MKVLGTIKVWVTKMEKHKEVKESRKKGLVIWIAKSLNHSDGNKGIKVWVTKIEKHKEFKES